MRAGIKYDCNEMRMGVLTTKILAEIILFLFEDAIECIFITVYI